MMRQHKEQSRILPFVPAGKIRCFVTGEFRKDTPEEDVRQRWARSLVDEYGYDRTDIAVEFPVKMGSSRRRSDIVVFNPGGGRSQDNVVIVIEAKRETVTASNKSKGIEQLKSYMSACSSCKFGLWVGSEKLAFEKTTNGAIEETGDIPGNGQTEPQPPTFQSLTPAVDLKAALRRCHNYIYANEGLQKQEAFLELQKLIFCKVLDEYEMSDSLRFYVHGNERKTESGQRRLGDERISPLFEEVKKRYRYIFKPNDEIELSGMVLAYIVQELQRYTFLGTKTDVKGAAYEELVGANLRGDRGEFFTPRNVCDMTVRMVLSLFPPANRSSLRVLDCCCGTGGFLVAVVNHLRETLSAFEKSRGGSESEIRSRVGYRVKEVAERNLFGMDINPSLVRTTQMNLVMHGDGSANVFRGNSLSSPGQWEDQDAAKQMAHGSFDVVVTNPPFGGKAFVDDPQTLSRFELTNFDAKDPRNLMPAEQLFVEGSLKFVKPGGYLAIVLPDSILNNPSLAYIRKWLLQNTRIVASIDLPKTTFAEGGGVPNPSVLFVQRLNETEIKLALSGALDGYDIFMAIPKTVGIDLRGNPEYFRTPDGLIVLDEEDRPTKDDELPLVAEAFEEWYQG